MAQERRHKSRSRRRRGRFGFFYQLLSVLLVAAALTTACVVFFRVNNITVIGNSRYTVQEVIEASGIQQGDNLITLSPSRVAARIRLRLPYVSSVSIRRALPDTVVLEIEEHAAAAAISDGKGWWYIAAQGKVLEQVGSPGSVMSVTGLTAQDPVPGELVAVEEEQASRLEYVLDLLMALDAREMLADCSALDCSRPGVLLLDYRDFRLKLPSTGEFDYMLGFLEGIFKEGRVDRDGSGTFDFTIEEGKAVYSQD